MSKEKLLIENYRIVVLSPVYPFEIKLEHKKLDFRTTLVFLMESDRKIVTDPAKETIRFPDSDQRRIQSRLTQLKQLMEQGTIYITESEFFPEISFQRCLVDMKHCTLFYADQENVSHEVEWEETGLLSLEALMGTTESFASVRFHERLATHLLEHPNDYRGYVVTQSGNFFKITHQTGKGRKDPCLIIVEHRTHPSIQQWFEQTKEKIRYGELKPNFKIEEIFHANVFTADISAFYFYRILKALDIPLDLISLLTVRKYRVSFPLEKGEETILRPALERQENVRFICTEEDSMDYLIHRLTKPTLTYETETGFKTFKYENDYGDVSTPDVPELIITSKGIRLTNRNRVDVKVEIIKPTKE